VTISITPIGAGFVAEASGLDLREPLAPEQRQAIVSAMDQYGVLVFRGQRLTTTEHAKFGMAFGPLDVGIRAATKVPSALGLAGVDDVSNVSPDNVLATRSSYQIISSMANRLWHKDAGGGSVSYSILNALVVPGEGGETEFSDLRAAYDALPPALRAEAEGRVVVHQALRSRLSLGMTYTEEQINGIPAAELPLVRVHAGSGRKHLFIGAHASHVVGMTVAEGRILLADLQEHATQQRFVYSHRWSVDDLVMWDNRCTMHRGRRYDLDSVRQLRRVTVRDAAANS
jgi:alpha-ketoglutarate-dependent 2,4-dichlorophenoxyacetate dioxygenase